MTLTQKVGLLIKFADGIVNTVEDPDTVLQRENWMTGITEMG